VFIRGDPCSSHFTPVWAGTKAAVAGLHYDDGVLRKLHSHLVRTQLLSAGDRVAVACSGGADSTALAVALAELRQELGVVVSVAHLNHGLRVEADADEKFVRELAASLGSEFHAAAVDVRAISQDRRISLEAAGRAARYEFFARLTGDGLVDKVATAHTADDQAETVLLRLARGAGTRGLAGIYDRVRGRTIIRPMLGIRREEVETFLRRRGQPWREDATNRDPQFTRNRVRHELLPLLERDYNPNIRRVLNETAEIARAEQDWWDRQVAEALDGLRRGDAPDIAALDAKLLAAMPVAVQRRVLKHVAESQGRALDFAHIERIRRMVLEGKAASQPILSDLTAEVVRKHDGQRLLTLAVNRREHVSGGYSYQFTVPGRVELRERGTVLCARIVPPQPASPLLDRSVAGRTLTVRNVRPGDRFHPYGRSEQKLKFLLQEFRIPAAQRPSWPVATLADGPGEEIVWVASLPPSARYAASGAAGVVIEELPLPIRES